MNSEFFELAKVGSPFATEVSVSSPSCHYPDSSAVLRYITTQAPQAGSKTDVSKLSKYGTAVTETMQAYLRRPCASSSALKEALKNPASFFFYMNDADNFTETDKPEFSIGAFARMAFLKPKLFDKCRVEPVYDVATKSGTIKAIRFYEQLNRFPEEELCDDMSLLELKSYLVDLKRACSHIMVTDEQKQIIAILKRNYQNYGGGIIPMLLNGAQSEVSFYGEDKATGIQVKARPDAFNTEQNIGVNAVVSFKTTTSTSVDAFLYHSARCHHELTQGMYQQVLTEVTDRPFNVSITIMVQTVAPYQLAVFWWSADDIQNGKYKYRYALDTVRACMDSETWPGFEALAECGNYGIINMKQPGWSHKLLKPVDVHY